MLVRKEIVQRPFWQLSVEDTAGILQTNVDSGLSDIEAAERLEIFGRNSFQSAHRSHWFTLLISQLKSPLILILIVAGIVTILLAHYRDAVFIFVAVIVNSALGFYQENKAERALAELKTYLKQRARVIRSGKEREIDAEELVPGDVIRLSQGDRVPADGRVFFVNDLQVDEAVLTGESLPVGKETISVEEKTAVGDQTSLFFAGTLITQGVGAAIVCRTAAATELGKIAALIAASENEKTPLQKAITSFSISSSVILGLMTVAVFVIGVLSGYSRTDMFLTAVAVAVSAIPEGLPVSMTVILAVGVERMVKRKGVVRKLVAAEALGSTTVVLTDKTGTLTMAKMILSQLLPRDIDEVLLLRRALANTSVLVENPSEEPQLWRMNGRIMEMALVRAAAIRGMAFEEITATQQSIQSMPFNAVQKFSVSLIKEGKKQLLVFLGAPDILLAHTSLSSTARQQVLNDIEALASSGERVLGVASKEIESSQAVVLSKHLPLEQLSFDGLITFRDPVRPGIAHAVKRIGEAGIRTVIMTGDHRGTAVAVAREIGITANEQSVLDAVELSHLSDKQLLARLPHLAVVSRVTPFDKLRIATLYQQSGEIVAMTGDGVNDAPSIKQADVGIAMGSGTEVAQSVADLVLLDDNFETIVAAIEEGRQIVGNIKKVLVYLFSSVTDGLILIGGSLVTGLPLPLTALQILWVNFFADSFPALSFAFEKDPDSFAHIPKKSAGLFDRTMRLLVLIVGLSTSLLLFVLYVILLRQGFDAQLVRTFTFAAFGTYTLFVAFSVRSLERGIWSIPLFSNRYLTIGTLIGLILMALALYHPFLQSLFGTVALPPLWAFGVVAVGLLNIILIEAAKRWMRSARYTGKAIHA